MKSFKMIINVIIRIITIVFIELNCMYSLKPKQKKK